MIKMKRLCLVPIILLIFSCATSVDFIPDPDFSLENPYYYKISPDEVEIISERPKRDFQLVGTVIFRNFVSPTDMKSELATLQNEMYKLKIDGVWIFKKSLETIPPLIVNTKNQDGMTVAYTETNKEMGKLTGYPFRYRKINDNDPTKVR